MTLKSGPLLKSFNLCKKTYVALKLHKINLNETRKKFMDTIKRYFDD